MVEHAQQVSSSVIGRYVLHDQIAFGGTATIHVGRLIGPIGFARTVAIKRLHGSFAANPAFVAMFIDEARLAARIRHPNVVSIIDVVAENGELLLVMDYVHGESLAGLLSTASERKMRCDPNVVVKIMTEALSGLHTAHELKNEQGESLGVVHRDVSPQNILVAADGVAHLIDFGIAKAIGRVQHTQEGQVKGKLRYMAPEQLESGAVDRRTDVFAAAAVLWEALVGRFMFSGTDAQLLYSVLSAPIPPPSTFVPGLAKALENVVMKGLERDPDKRFATALEMADALEAATRPATSRAVARWMQFLAADTLQERARLINGIELAERSSGNVPMHRESGSMPRELLDPGRIAGDGDQVATEQARDLERYTLPLPLQTFDAQTTSAVHYRAELASRLGRSVRPWWRMAIVVALALAGIAALLVLTRAPKHESQPNIHTSSPEVNQAEVAAPLPQHGTVPPVSTDLDGSAPQVAGATLEPEHSLVPPPASLSDETASAEQPPSSASGTRAKRTVLSRRPVPVTAAAAPTESPAQPTKSPLYVRD